jgi:hypothetical protein
VKGWYPDRSSLSAEPDGVSKVEGRTDERRVRFNPKVTYRPIPVEGRGRRTPARGTRSLVPGGLSLDMLEETKIIYCDEGTHDRIDECKCSRQGRRKLSKGERWADMAESSDEDEECAACARTWFSPGVEESDDSFAGVPAIAEEVVQSQSGNLSLDSFEKSHSGKGKCNIVIGRTGWLSDGHLEAGRAVPSVGRPNSLSDIFVSGHFDRGANSAARRRRRRSVGRDNRTIDSGALYTHTHRTCTCDAERGACACTYVYMY